MMASTLAWHFHSFLYLVKRSKNIKYQNVEGCINETDFRRRKSLLLKWARSNPTFFITGARYFPE